jgi:hypothetical protein
MTASVRLFAVAAALCALGGCATTVDRYGASQTGFAVWNFCEPTGWTIDWGVNDVPELLAPERRYLEPRIADVPELPPTRGIVLLEIPTAEVPDLGAPARTRLPDRAPPQVPDLPPTRGGIELPGTLPDVPTLAAPERRGLESTPVAYVELTATARLFDLGAPNGPALDTLGGCTPGLVLASNSCRLSARAAERELPRRYQ